jgi:hypothetical protein
MRLYNASFSLPHAILALLIRKRKEMECMARELGKWEVAGGR